MKLPKKKIRFDVTNPDIAVSKCRDPKSCMVKTSIQRTLTGRYHLPVESIRVRGNAVVVVLDRGLMTETIRLAIPDRAYQAICNFDACESAIEQHPDLKMEILDRVGVRAFTFEAIVISTRTRKRGSARQAQVEENRRRLVANARATGRQLSAGYMGTGRRYLSTANQPSARAVARATRAAVAEARI
jgi:hypothetical protein